MPYTGCISSGDLLHFLLLGYVVNKVGSPSLHKLIEVRPDHRGAKRSKEVRGKLFKSMLDEGKHASVLIISYHR